MRLWVKLKCLFCLFQQVTYTNASDGPPQESHRQDVLRFLTGAPVIPPGNSLRTSVVTSRPQPVHLNMDPFETPSQYLNLPKKHCKTKHLMQFLTITVVVMTIYRVYYNIICTSYISDMDRNLAGHVNNVGTCLEGRKTNF